MLKNIKKITIEVLALLLSLTILIPFYFAFVNSLKNNDEASLMKISFPSSINLIENYNEVILHGNIFQSFFNSIFITVFSVAILILVSSMAAFVLQRRKSEASTVMDFFVLAGLIVPPAIVPTIWIMQFLHISNTKLSVILIETVLQFSFATVLYKSFFSSIPKELDEAAVVDGCGSFRMFFSVIFPLLKPITITIMIITGISIFNDFTIPLYFLNGMNNTTIQLTVYYFFGKYSSEWNLVFADIILITIPPMIFYLFFNKQIIEGMTAGAVKG